MRNRLNLILRSLLLTGILLANADQLLAQGKVDVSAGIGIPELLDLGVRYQIKQLQIGITYGFWPQTDESVTSFGGDFYCHFGRKANLSSLRPWYGRTGITLLHDQLGTTIEKYVYLNARLGRDFNFSEKLGMDIAAGAIFQLAYESNIENGFSIDYPVLPSLGISFFYRL
jgi:hypothetical protein